MIHPTDTFNRQDRSIDGQLPLGSHPGHGVVVGGVALALGLLADPVDPIDDGGLQWGQAKPNGHGGITGLEQMVSAISLEGPVLHPNVESVHRRTCLSEGAPADLFTEKKGLFIFIGQGKVGEIEALQGPLRLTGPLPPEPGPEKRQLVAKRPPIGRSQVTGVVPPLDPELGMGKVVTGKGEGPSRQGSFEFLGPAKSRAEEKETEPYGPPSFWI